MCAIVGMTRSRGKVNAEVLGRMRDTMHHRGPDDKGEWISVDGRVALAHRRLSIIDLSPSGHQPMSDSAESCHIVFNGEIYNHLELRRELEELGHRFRSRSDTEVILEAYRAWGTECVTRLNGMFAFAIYDHGRRRLFLARDRVGEKPLYYAHSDTGFAFASELKALMARPEVPRRLDLEALEFYLAYGYVPADLCILQAVKKLLPAQSLTLDLDQNSVHLATYWKLPESPEQLEESSENLCQKLDYLLQDAVRKQLEADVPVGILLSGGIDSSLVTAMAARTSRRVNTFTITFPGEKTHDEGPDAREVASHFGTSHTELAAESASVGLLPELARQYDEPIGDSSMIPTYLVCRLIRQHATVALGGDGGDELFGGYLHYGWLLRQERWKRRIPAFARSLISTIASRIIPVGARGRNYCLGFERGIDHAIAHVNMFWDTRSRRRLIVAKADARPGVAGPEMFRKSLCKEGRGLPGQAMEADFHSYLPDDILVKVDRASMLASLEVRAPWLDHRIVEFAFGQVPNAMRANLLDHKILPRELASRMLPADLSRKRKHGFSIPLKSWLRGDWGSFMRSILAEASPDLFSQTEIRNLLHGQRRGTSNNTERIFALTMFELWRREYRVAVG